jgi:hypothetical protein
VNYLPFVSWGMYGGSTAKERANFFASWGLMASLPNLTANFIAAIAYYFRRRRA